MRPAFALVRGAALGALAFAWIAAGCSAAGVPERAATAEPAVARPVPVPSPPRPAPPAIAAIPTPPPAPRPAALRGPRAPMWNVGDQWAFRWESAEGQGDYVWTVDRVEALDGVPQYVVRTGSREIFFRASDLATSLETASGRVERRNSPPRLAFSWPLALGTMWRQTYAEERAGSGTAERSIAWKVEQEEDVRVGAGAFKAFRIVARHAPTPDVMYEMWYAPEVKQWVRLKEHFPTGVRYRELTAFNLRS